MIINLGDAPFKAFIKVTYPNGTCTVSLGDKSFTHSGGGTHTFTVNKKGTWTVRATSNAGVVETKTASVTTRGQIVNLTLQCILYIIKDGVEAGAGGFTVHTSGIYVSGGYITNSGYNNGKALKIRVLGTTETTRTVASSNNSFDLSKFKTLSIRGWTKDKFNHETYRVTVRSGGADVKSVAFSQGEGNLTPEPTVRTIDVSSIGTSCSIHVTYSSWWVAEDNYAEFYIDQLMLIP